MTQCFIHVASPVERNEVDTLDEAVLEAQAEETATVPRLRCLDHLVKVLCVLLSSLDANAHARRTLFEQEVLNEKELDEILFSFG